MDRTHEESCSLFKARQDSSWSGWTTDTSKTEPAFVVVKDGCWSLKEDSLEMSGTYDKQPGSSGQCWNGINPSMYCLSEKWDEFIERAERENPTRKHCGLSWTPYTGKCIHSWLPAEFGVKDNRVYLMSYINNVFSHTDEMLLCNTITEVLPLLEETLDFTKKKEDGSKVQAPVGHGRGHEGATEELLTPPEKHTAKKFLQYVRNELVQALPYNYSVITFEHLPRTEKCALEIILWKYDGERLMAQLKRMVRYYRDKVGSADRAILQKPPEEALAHFKRLVKPKERLTPNPYEWLLKGRELIKEKTLGFHKIGKLSRFQAIVKQVEFRLTPENPSYKGGSWHLEGLQHERILATVIYYYKCENVTKSFLEFRKYVGVEPPVTEETMLQFGMVPDEPRSWYLGEVEIVEGRAVAFPNDTQHRCSPFHLVDKTKPGVRKLLVLFLVDPEAPTVSTATVPRQQASYHYREAMFALSGIMRPAGIRFPVAVRARIMSYVSLATLGVLPSQAEANRSELQTIRSSQATASTRSCEEGFDPCPDHYDTGTGTEYIDSSTCSSSTPS